MILKSANAENTGVIDRVKLKEALIENIDKMNVIIEESLPQTNPMILEVMKNLDESNSGTIQKDDLRKALLSYDDKNLA